jgi:hypothetical protein
VRRGAALFVAFALGAFIVGQASAGTVTVGHADPPDSFCAGDTVYIPTGDSGGGNSYAVPAGSWTVTSWSMYGPSSGMDGALVIARKTGTNQWMVVYSSPAQTLAPNTLNTFAVPNVAVKKGDVIGAWYTAAGSAECASDVPGNTDEFDGGFGSPPSAGTPLDTISEGDAQFDISATLSGSGAGPAKAAPIPEVNELFLCYSKFQTDPGVWDTDTAAKLLVAGYWIPYGLAGNVDGGTNVGDYHLVCNLTGGQKTTGGFVDDGGGTWSADYASMPGLYPLAG